MEPETWGAGEASPSFISGIVVTGMPKDSRNNPGAVTRAGRTARTLMFTKSDANGVGGWYQKSGLTKHNS